MTLFFYFFSQDGTATQKSFGHIPSIIEAEEAEEIGVEHLLRDVKSPHQFGTLSTRVTAQISSLRGLHSRLVEIRDYLRALVGKGKLPVNHAIMYNLQDIFNLLPNLDAGGVGVGGNGGVGGGESGGMGETEGEGGEKRVEKAFKVELNDQLLVVYLSSLIRSVLALHDLSEWRSGGWFESVIVGGELTIRSWYLSREPFIQFVSLQVPPPPPLFPAERGSPTKHHPPPPTSRAEIDDIKSPETKALEKAADQAGVKVSDVEKGRKENTEKDKK